MYAHSYSLPVPRYQRKGSPLHLNCLPPPSLPTPPLPPARTLPPSPVRAQTAPLAEIQYVWFVFVDLKSEIWNLGFQISDLRFQIPDFRFRNLKSEIWNLRFQISDIRFRNLKYEI